MRSGTGVDYGPALEAEIARITMAVEEHPEVAAQFPSRWLATELLENGEEIRQRLSNLDGWERVIAEADAALTRLGGKLGDDARVVVAERRYQWIDEVVAAAVSADEEPVSISDRLDRIFTHRLLGLPLFLFAMWIVFKLTADVSAVYVDWIDEVMSGSVSRWMASVVGAMGLGGSWLESLLVDGVVAGVGGVLVFIPVLMTLFLALAVLEDSGYMARAALVMDRAMRAVGLAGRSFLPMMVGFGCTVPAVYATRMLEKRKDRILTGLLVPFMSCGARLPVYVLFATVFFPRNRGLVVFSMYILGVLVALAVGAVLNRTVFSGNATAPLLMELPAYRLPTFKSIWFHMWKRTSAFLRNAGTIILATSMVVWVLMATPISGGRFAAVEVDDSAFGTVSSAIAPALSPAGFGTWESTGALASGFVAKEVVISTLAQVHGATDAGDAVDQSFLDDLADVGSSFVAATRDTVRALPGIVGIDLNETVVEEDQTGLMASIGREFEESSGGHGALAGLAFIVFVLVYTPCMAAVAASRRELGARWMWTSVLGQTALAWVMAVAVFQGGRVLGLG